MFIKTIPLMLTIRGMDIKNKKIILSLLSTLLLLPGISFAAGYYPKAAPTAWYTKPDKWLGFSGSGFAPYEKVTLSGAAKGSVLADADGIVSIPKAFVVPFSWQNTKKTVVLTGNESAYAIPVTVTVGSFYPNVTPSTYYAAYGQTETATATGFAPKETVEFLVDGVSVGDVTASAVGSAGISFVAPSVGSTFALTAVGLSSGRTSTRTITLH
jgi:hypothetical protein